MLAQLLSAEGFSTIDQIAVADNGALESMEGFDVKLVKDLKARAIEYIEKQNEKIIEKLEQLGVEQELIDALDLTPEYILKLAEYGVKTIEDLGEMTVEEFRSIVPENNISTDDIKELVNFAKSQSK